MNRPLLVAAIGGVVVVIAIALNFVLLEEDVHKPPEQQLAAEVEAASRAAEQAKIEEQKADEAAHRAADARAVADRATAEAEQARKSLAEAQSRAASDVTAQAAAERAASETAAREAAAREAQVKAEKSNAEAEQAKVAAQKAAKIAQAEAAATRQMARATPDTPAAPAPAVAGTAGLPAVAPSTPPAGRITSPTFDVVRVENDGSVVIAGRAAPKSEVVVRAGSEVIGQVVANANGEWVLVPGRPLRPGSLELGLAARIDGREVPADSVVVIVVPDRGAPAQVAVATPPAAPLAVSVPREGGGASRVLQSGKGKPEDMRIAVEAVDYDDAGNLTISGRTGPGGVVQIYLDNTFIGRATAGPDGRWSLKPDRNVTPGLYNLRADLVDANGNVLARVAFPFTRAEPIADLKPGSFVVVQPGNSLWRIARRTYGAGTQYTEIYAANQAQIKDPDLIYPGQIFQLPQAN